MLRICSRVCVYIFSFLHLPHSCPYFEYQLCTHPYVHIYILQYKGSIRTKYKFKCIQTHIHRHLQVYICMYICTYLQKYVLTNVHRMYACIAVGMNICICHIPIQLDLTLLSSPRNCCLCCVRLERVQELRVSEIALNNIILPVGFLYFVLWVFFPQHHRVRTLYMLNF